MSEGFNSDRFSQPLDRERYRDERRIDYDLRKADAEEDCDWIAEKQARALAKGIDLVNGKI